MCCECASCISISQTSIACVSFPACVCCMHAFNALGLGPLTQGSQSACSFDSRFQPLKYVRPTSQKFRKELLTFSFGTDDECRGCQSASSTYVGSQPLFLKVCTCRQDSHNTVHSIVRFHYGSIIMMKSNEELTTIGKYLLPSTGVHASCKCAPRGVTDAHVCSRDYIGQELNPLKGG